MIVSPFTLIAFHFKAETRTRLIFTYIQRVLLSLKIIVLHNNKMRENKLIFTSVFDGILEINLHIFSISNSLLASNYLPKTFLLYSP